MADENKTVVAVGQRNVEVSNLDKVLYPDDHIIKAEVIAYYASVAPAMLRYVSGRPLALVRYPDGLDGESFFHKNRPKGAPAWLHHVLLGEKDPIDYVVPVEQAALVWLANMAALELHMMTVREPQLDRPDHLAFDIDPQKDQPFEHAVELAFRMKAYLEGFEYQPYVKTSGKKGLHVVVPLKQEWDVDECFQAAKELASGFVRQNPGTSMSLGKERRGGKTFIDIYRNARSQTMVAPYSLRGAPGAPVSCPLTWSELEELADPSTLNIGTVQERLQTSGDAWEGMQAHASILHGHRRRGGGSGSPSLATYKKKRDFARTPEPAPRHSSSKEGDRFVVQLHHASHRHFDLRLEEGGTLRSWAIPKGLPPRPGIKRLAVATEDHPLEYLTFEGTIPKGEYGGGIMWVFTSGRYEITKRSKSGLHFFLRADGLGGEYRLYNTEGKNWLIERIDEPVPDWPHEPAVPMLALNETSIPKGDYTYEIKWDGVRAIISIDEGKLRIHTRNLNDITSKFPELQVPEAFQSVSAILDGEIICLGPDGKPDFQAVVSRVHRSTGRGSRPSAYKKWPIHCMLFDCLYLDGRRLVNEPLHRRREWLAHLLREEGAYRITHTYDDGAGLLEVADEIGLEGIIGKRKSSKYLPGQRSPDWLKIKTKQTADCLIVGYTRGKGDRKGTMGAIHVAEFEDGHYVYRGKVGTGFTDVQLRQIEAELEDVPTFKPGKDDKNFPRNLRDTRWIRPVKVCEVTYSEKTKDGMFRHGVFVRMRPDREPIELIEEGQEITA
jgi:bifunctional non-homologous end joining protein LigD